jgi:hypothetical protein
MLTFSQTPTPPASEYLASQIKRSPVSILLFPS